VRHPGQVEEYGRPGLPPDRFPARLERRQVLVDQLAAEADREGVLIPFDLMVEIGIFGELRHGVPPHGDDRDESDDARELPRRATLVLISPSAGISRDSAGRESCRNENLESTHCSALSFDWTGRIAGFAIRSPY